MDYKSVRLLTAIENPDPPARVRQGTLSICPYASLRLLGVAGYRSSVREAQCLSSPTAADVLRVFDPRDHIGSPRSHDGTCVYAGMADQGVYLCSTWAVRLYAAGSKFDPQPRNSDPGTSGLQLGRAP